MTLDEFIKEQQEQLDGFRRYYKRKQREEADEKLGHNEYWPSELASGDWDEQLRAFDPSELTTADIEYPDPDYSDGPDA